MQPYSPTSTHQFLTSGSAVTVAFRLLAASSWLLPARRDKCTPSV